MKIPSYLLFLVTSYVGVSHGFSFVSVSPRHTARILYAENEEKVPAPPSIPSPPDTPVSNYHDYDYDNDTSQKVGEALKKLWDPIVSVEIEKGVPSETIKGAALTSILTSVFVLGVNPMMVSAIAAAAVSGAYVAVTPGPGGKVMRSLGRFSWVLKKSIVNLVEDKVGIKKNISVDDDEDLGKILKEARNAVKLVKNEMKPESPQDKAKRISEQVRITAEEETRKEQEELERQQAEMKAKEEEAARLAEEEAKLAEEAAMLAEEEAKLAEEEAARLAEEEAKLAEEEAARLAEEEERLAAEEEEEEEESDDEIDEDDWEESIQLAQKLDGFTEQMNGDSDQWKEAQDLAKQLALESNEEVTAQMDEPDMEDLGRAARAAVEQYEAQMKQESEFEEKIKHKQQGQAVESSSSDSESNDATDFESMKVVELKDELRSRGLKVSGRKAELIERLKQSIL